MASFSPLYGKCSYELLGALLIRFYHTRCMVTFRVLFEYASLNTVEIVSGNYIHHSEALLYPSRIFDCPYAVLGGPHE